MSLFEINLEGPIKNSFNRIDTGLPIHLPKLSKYINYLERSQTIVIGGRQQSGKSSFVDDVYFLRIFHWWFKLGYDENGHVKPDPNRPKLKMIYFNMRTTEKLKIQKLLCLYLKLEYEIIIDIPTLLNGIGKLYDLDEIQKSAIFAAKEFFDELEENLHLINGKQTPSGISNHVKRIMNQYGQVNTEGKFEYKKSNEGQYTIIIINSTDELLPESDGYHTMGEEDLQKRLGKYLDDFKEQYKSSNIVIKPTKSNNSRIVKDSEASYKDLGVMNKFADVGLVLYSPFEENNNKYLNYPVEELVIRGKNRFKTVTIVRNSNGVSNLTVGLIFLGECGYIRESPHPERKHEFDQIILFLTELDDSFSGNDNMAR